jgi:peptide-methionine (S)-S-oxide reductase
MKLYISLFVALVLIIGGSSCRSDAKGDTSKLLETSSDSSLQHATFAMGCFWHSEEIFLETKGVKEALPGYCGGTTANPSYDDVGSGTTGHAESVDIAFDPREISYDKLLEVFFAEHDPTTLNRQGPDEGSQYRSAVFYHNADQKRAVEAYIAKLKASHRYSNPIVTEIAPFSKFYRAEDYHLRYFRKHPDQPYVAAVTTREVQKFRKDFPDLVKQ